MQYYNWSLRDVEEMYPFERAIYIAMINNYQQEQEEKAKKQNNHF